MNLSPGISINPNLSWPKTFITPANSILPLVTCIMPTADRHDFIPKSIQYFLDQDYLYKELVIIDDGLTSIGSLLPNLYCIRHFYLQETRCIGLKRNMACEKAAGSIIMHWDDDDWYAPDWITHQVNSLLQSEADVCGLNHVQFFSLKESKYYVTKNGNKSVLSGATLAYHKSYWNKYPFKNIHVGEETFFVGNKKAKVFAHDYYQGFLAIVHQTNARLREF